jgi:hypothetical protein
MEACDGVHSPRAVRALMRQAAQELGRWDTKTKTAAFDPVEMVRRLNEGASERTRFGKCGNSKPLQVR